MKREMEVCQSDLFIWHLVCKLADLLVFCDQGGGALLDSDLDQGAGEEANSPAGGARGDGGVVVGGVQFIQHQDFDFKHFCI